MSCVSTPTAPRSPVSGSMTGLTSQEAAARLRRDGPNTLPTTRGPTTARQLAQQLVHLFAVMLWVAAALAVLAGLVELAVAIVAVVVANAVFAFLQEHRAERAAARLRDLMPRRATVLRDGHRRSVDASELVVGDVVVLEAGDRISADARLEEVHVLAIDGSTLTGESDPVRPDVHDPVFAGTFVLEGDGLATVTATGAATRLGRIARLTTTGTRPPSPLARELRRLVHTIAVIAISVGAAFFLVGLGLGIAPAEGFVFAIGITVALVPEGLLPTVTLTLGLGAQRMAQQGALVRRLESVETLGSTTFVCTDKTGTLTVNQMSVVEAWTPAGVAHVEGPGYGPEAVVDAPAAVVAALREAATTAVLCSTGRITRRGDAWVAEGDTTDAAIHALAIRLGVSSVAGPAEPVRRRFAFDARRRRMSVVTARQVAVKGAPDGLLPLCPGAPDDAADALADMTARGLRVIAVAERPAPAHLPIDAGEVERDLRLLALLGLEDPPRPGAAEALAACRRGGVRVAMVTGDHPATALAIAREVGLTQVERWTAGADLPADLDELGRLLDHDGVVVARADPEDKLRIAQALQRRGHVVAMTGDGVNDGPALHQADIGVAMGAGGTDVAREAADLVLLDDDFETVVTAIAYGRATFANLRRFLTYHLTDNVAELAPFVVWALSGGRIPLALTVLQVLALDLGTDTLSAVALGAEAPRREVLHRPPVAGRLLDGLVARRAFGVLGPVEAGLGLAAFAVTLLAGGWTLGAAVDRTLLLQASGGTFATIVLAQSANAFACRSAWEWPGALGWTTNWLLVTAVGIELTITSVFLFQPDLARILRHAPPTALGWSIAVGSVALMLLADGTDKWLRRRGSTHRSPRG